MFTDSEIKRNLRTLLLHVREETRFFIGLEFVRESCGGDECGSIGQEAVC